MTSHTARGMAATLCWVAVGLAVVAFARHAGYLWSWAAVFAGVSLVLGSYAWWRRQYKERGRS